MARIKANSALPSHQHVAFKPDPDSDAVVESMDIQSANATTASACETPDAQTPLKRESQEIQNNWSSTHIQESLLALLEKNPCVTGAFSYKRTHASWCNPGLDIDGVGILGLPLGARDAATLRDALVNEGSNTEKVRYDNGDWPDFLERVVDNVCNALGTDLNSTKPHAILTDLLFNDSLHGSSFATACTRSCGQAFASLLIVLPSKFSGGALRVSYGDRSETYDYSVRAAANLTVLAWQAGALPEFAPLSDGYYIAMSYQIIHSAESPAPTISLQDDVVSRLRQLLSQWNAMRSEGKPAPQKIIHLLGNKYPHDVDLRHDSLNAADARTVSLLGNVGRLHGFNVGLDRMKCVVHGFTDSDTGGDPSGHSSGEDSDTVLDSGPKDEWDFGEVDSEIKRLVLLNGNIVTEILDHDMEEFSIDLYEVFGTAEYHMHWQQLVTVHDQPRRGRWRPRKYKFCRVFHWDVVVLWPQSAQFTVTQGANAIPNACEVLRSRENPTPEDAQLVEVILINASKPHHQDILSSICRIALMWNDHALWLRTVRVCNAARSISAIGTEKVQMAIHTFGFDQMQPYLEQVVQGEYSDITALQFLDDIETWCEEQDSFELIETIPPWAAVQRTKRYNVLKTPIQYECATLTKLVVKRRGGGVVFKHKILPKIVIVTIANSSFLIQYSKSLRSDWASELPPAVLSQAVHELLRAALDHCLHVIPPCETTLLFSLILPPENDRLSEAQMFISACCLAGEVDLARAGLTKLKDSVSGLSPARRVQNVYFPLIFYLAKEKKQLPAIDLTEFCEYSLLSWLDAVDAISAFASEDIDALFRVVSIGGSWSLLNTRIVPKLETLALGEVTLRALISALHTNGEHIGATAKTMLLSLLRKWAGLVPANKCTAVETIAYPVTLGLPEACSFVFEVSINQPTITAQYARDRLEPLLTTILAVCSKHNIPATSPHFAPAVRQIILLWMGKVLRPTPDLEAAKRYLRSLERWTCECVHCKPVRDFLIVGIEREKGHRIPRKTDVKHVKGFLTNTASSIATWKESTSSGFQRFVVTKTEQFFAPQQWKQDREKAQEFLREIASSADEAGLQAVLGDDYESIVSGLRDPACVTPNVAPVIQHPQPSAGASLHPTYTPAARPGIGYWSGPMNTRDGYLPYDDPPPAKRRRF